MAGLSTMFGDSDDTGPSSAAMPTQDPNAGESGATSDDSASEGPDISTQSFEGDGLLGSDSLTLVDGPDPTA